jgi:hypothetical protein
MARYIGWSQNHFSTSWRIMNVQLYWGCHCGNKFFWCVVLNPEPLMIPRVWFLYCCELYFTINGWGGISFSIHTQPLILHRCMNWKERIFFPMLELLFFTLKWAGAKNLDSTQIRSVISRHSSENFLCRFFYCLLAQCVMQQSEPFCWCWMNAMIKILNCQVGQTAHCIYLTPCRFAYPAWTTF